VSSPHSGRPLREAVLVFAGVTLAAALLHQLARLGGFFRDYESSLIAVVFIYAAVWMAHRHGEELAAIGFTTRPRTRSLLFAAAVLAIVFPLFLFGFHAFYSIACGWRIDALAPPFMCARFQGLAALAHPRLPGGLLGAVFAQLVVVALPEELFFRGYLLRRLEQGYPPARRFLGGGIGVALLLSALLFALGHVLVDGNPRRLAVFFPGLLFGWLRSATGSILAGTLVHAASNLYIEALQRTFLS
jgi:membrane protease YdiL (CAAX protease family)